VSSAGSLVAPFGIAIEAAGKALVFDQGAASFAGAVVRVDTSTGAQTIVSSGGSFADPFGIVVLPEPVPAFTTLTFTGTTQGGVIDLVINGVTVHVVITGGATAEQLARAVGAAVNASAPLQAAGITASIAGDTVTTNGNVTSITETDPGITVTEGEPSPSIPTLSHVGLAALSLLLLAAGMIRARARRRVSPR
jgi:hypothetical protein